MFGGRRMNALTILFCSSRKRACAHKDEYAYRERARGATDHGTVMHVVVDGGREEDEDQHHVVQGLDLLFAEESPRPLVHPFALLHERGEEVVEDHAQDPFLQNLGPPCPDRLLSKLAGIHALGRAGSPELNNGGLSQNRIYFCFRSENDAVLLDPKLFQKRLHPRLDLQAILVEQAQFMGIKSSGA